MTSVAEQSFRPNNQLSLPDDVYTHPEWRTEYAAVQAFRRGAMEVLVAEPLGGIRLDPATGEPAKPIFVALGINGDQKLPWTAIALAEEDQRQVIGIRYPEKLEGKAKRTLQPALASKEGVIPRVTDLDMQQAADILTTLDELQAAQVDALAESRGAISTVLAMRQVPERFGDTLLVHPAGLGNESYRQAHSGAAKIAIHNLGRKALLLERMDPLARELKAKGGGSGSRLAHDPLGWRREQVSVAVARQAHLPDMLAAIRSGMTPDQSVTIAYDPKDPAIRRRRLVKQNVGNIPLVETHFGRHGFGYSREALRGVAEYFQHTERVRAVNR